MDFLIAAALLPAIGLMLYVYNKDTVEKEPVGLIVRVFVLGAIAGPVAAVIEYLLIGFFESTVPPGVALVILEYFVGVAMVEEALKYAAVLTVRKNPAFNYVFDGIVYAVAAALGFAALENIFYVLDGGMGVAVMRAIFSVPGHCADGVIMGCFFGLARQREVRGNKSGARTYYLLAFILPVLEHGIYDTALSLDNDMMVLFALAVEIVFIVIGVVLVHRMSKNDQPISAIPPTPQGQPLVQGQPVQQGQLGVQNQFAQQVQPVQGQNVQQGQFAQQGQPVPGQFAQQAQPAQQGQLVQQPQPAQQGQPMQQAQPAQQGQPGVSVHYSSQSQYAQQGQPVQQAQPTPQGQPVQQGQSAPQNQWTPQGQWIKHD